MTQTEKAYEIIAEQLIATHANVQEGRMMRCPAIMFNGRVFAFAHDEKMVFKLGKGFDPSHLGIAQWSHLNPFKNKPPMTAWFEIGVQDEQHWPQLSEKALEYIRSEK